MILKSLQWRLVSFFCLIAFCLIIPIGLFLNQKVEAEYYKDFTQGIEQGLESWGIKDSNPTLKRIQDSLKGSGASIFNIVGDDRSVTVADRNGNCLYSSDPLFIIKQEQNETGRITIELLQSGNFVKAMKNDGKNGDSKRLEKIGEVEFFDYAVRKGEYILYFRYYKSGWQEIIDGFNNIIVTSLVLALAVAFILGYMLSKTITAPVVKLMHKARSIAAGDFDRVLEVRSDDEIGKLTDSFNSMTASLKSTLTEISSEKNKMETILNYMTDGVIAFNLKGEVIHTNPAAKRLLDSEVLDGTFNDYAAKYGLKYCIEDVVYLQTSDTREFTIQAQDKTLKLYFAVFTDEMKNPEGIISVLQDITEQQRLENMRREFVANVSHELRTPLTSVKSYAETLLDGALEDRETAERFLKVINSEADRMTRLVKDLLQLSRIENQQMQWNMEEVSFVSLVKNAAERLELEAKSKQQTLECYVLGDVPPIHADYGRIEQVVVNLVTNAIKYTPEGGKVSVFIGRGHNEVYVKVADTGIGIPEKDLPRIFERFYRVDKARSREMGGTGLGLSIAKEIVEAHGGVISITSVESKGTEVTVRLPASPMQQERLEA